MSKTFHLVSLGCAKNTVDSESMGQLMVKSGYHFEMDQTQADVLIVNTCGFIGPAKKESLQVLGELAANKKEGQMLIAAGCLTQRYGAEVVRQVPGVDGILGTRRWMDIVDVVQEIRDHRPPEPLYHLPDAPEVGTDERGTLRAAIQGASAYMKIADGCRRPCAFCAIPLIKGSAVSRPKVIILEEARHLQSLGVRELILIAQDTTDYGHDVGEKDGLAQLLTDMVVALENSSSDDEAGDGVEWIRIMYAFPGYVTDRLIEVMATHPQIIPYLDIPLQHAHPGVLRRMKRPANVDWVHRTLEKMRTSIPDLAIRTTFIVGYPGETEQEFQALLDFVEEIRFDRVGAFEFSFEPGTTSEPLGDPVTAEVKRERWERLMALQQNISLEKNQSYVGKRLDVLVEGRGDGISLARSYRDAPEIDGLVIVEGEIPVGSFVPVNITGAMAYDLSGVMAQNQPNVILDESKIVRIEEEDSMINIQNPETSFAILAVRLASQLVKQVEAELVSPAITKDDRSPVTVADFASQALVGHLLANRFPNDPLVGEEDSTTLRTSEGRATLEQVTKFVTRYTTEDSNTDPESVCEWIDHGNGEPADRFWTLDPIDGTKGFLRGDQYAVALALIVDGVVQVGVLGCPNLTDGYRPDVGGPGSLVVAARGEGTWVGKLDGEEENYARVHVSGSNDPAQARLLRSFESGHTNVSQVDTFAEALGVSAEPVRMDSQAKYAVLATGHGELYLRLLSPKRPDYREKIWDQAAGSILVEEAGGTVTDLNGKSLDFTAGKTLANNRGILASNQHLHKQSVNALRAIGA